MLTFTQRCAADQSSLAGQPGWFSALLRTRGVDTPEKARRFLQPSLADLHDPGALKGLNRAVALLRQAIKEHERILVYGDYDVDGICAAAILLETLLEEGADADFRIPSRHTEGYGLNEAAVREIAADFQLLITVDCGISSVKEVALARQLGLTVIVTDHHEPPDVLPEADAVLDPLLGDYPFRRLCGAGVALKICQAMQGMAGVEKRLELAALATVADVVPLMDENRVIVREGMLRMAHTSRPGLRALMEVAAVKPPLKSEHLAFRLGPRLNAAGRLEDAAQGVRLLLTKEEAEARAIAQHLEENNRARQQLERGILEEALQQVQETTDFREDRVLLAVGDGWNSGLIGLVAGRLCEKYHYPALVLSRQGDTLVGSCRSIPGLNMYQMLTACQQLFVRFGGHEQAAGLTIAESSLPQLRPALNRYIRTHCDDALFPPVWEYDLALPFREWTPGTLALLDQLEPTGCGNPAPVFLAADAAAQEMRRVGQDRSHLKVTLADAEGTVLGGIGFSMGEEADRGCTRVNALYTPALNEYNGRVSVQLRLQSLQPAAGALPPQGQEALLLSLLKELSYMQENGLFSAKEQGYPLQALSRAEALDCLRAPLGTLVLTRDTALAAELCRETGADLAMGQLNEPRPFSTVLCSWTPAALRDSWHRVILADGTPLPGETALLNRLCPRAGCLYLAEAEKVPPSRLPQLQQLCPTDEALRTLFRALRMHFPLLGRSAIGSLAELAATTGMPWQQLIIALEAFRETRLLTWTLQPFDLQLEPHPQRCAMTDSPLICCLRAGI